MKKHILGGYLTSILLSATAATEGAGAAGAAKAAEGKAGKGEGETGAKGRGVTPVATAQPSFSAADLIQQIEANPDGFETEWEDEEQTPEDGKLKAEGKESAAGEKGSKGEKEKEAATTTAPELNADQKAWMELRLAAKTPEEAAALDQDAPAFTDAEWAMVESQMADEGRGSKGEGQAADAAAATELTSVRTELATVKTELDTKAKRLAELEQKLAAAQTAPQPVANLHPLLTATPEQLAAEEQKAHQIKEWAMKHWDGVAAEGDQPAVTAEQVRTAYARADKLLTAVLPAARQTHQAFEEENQTARQVYPALFDAQAEPLVPGQLSPFQSRETILRTLPGLKAGLPQISTVIGDALVGETLRGVLLAEQPSADAVALRAALVKAVPGLAKLMPRLTAASSKPAMALSKKPIVPLARPSATGGRGVINRPGGAKAQRGAPSTKEFQERKAAHGGNDLEALTETLRHVNVE